MDCAFGFNAAPPGLRQTLLSEDKTVAFQPLPDPFAVLEDLVELYKSGLRSPLPFSPKRLTISRPHTRAGTHANAPLEGARTQCWETLTERREYHPWFELCFRGREDSRSAVAGNPFAFSNPCWRIGRGGFMTRSFDLLSATLDPASRFSKRAQAPAKRTLWQDSSSGSSRTRPSAARSSSPLTPRPPPRNCGTASALFSGAPARCGDGDCDDGIYSSLVRIERVPAKSQRRLARALRNFDEPPSIHSRFCRRMLQDRAFESGLFSMRS